MDTDREESLAALRAVSSSPVMLDEYGLPILDLAEDRRNPKYGMAYHRAFLWLNKYIRFDSRGKCLGSPHISEIVKMEQAR